MIIDTIPNTMSTLSSRIVEAVEMAKAKGNSIADIAKACQCSVQAVYQWIDPLNKMTELKDKSLLGLCKISGMNPWYLLEGEGDKLLVIASSEKTKAVVVAMQNMPEYKKDVLVATSNTLAEQPDKKNNGT